MSGVPPININYNEGFMNLWNARTLKLAMDVMSFCRLDGKSAPPTRLISLAPGLRKLGAYRK